MICPCCTSENINDLDNTFSGKRIKREAAAYLKKGLPARGRKLISYFAGISNLKVLDIGCGVGGVHHELLRQGVAQSVVGVDASSASLEAASQISKALAATDKTTYYHADFALNADEIEMADLVVLDRVICCYPHLQALYGAAVAHTNRFVALSYPIDSGILKFGLRVVNKILTWSGSGYHPFVHGEDEIRGIAENAGMTLVHSDRHSLWEIRVFEHI